MAYGGTVVLINDVCSARHGIEGEVVMFRY